MYPTFIPGLHLLLVGLYVPLVRNTVENSKLVWDNFRLRGDLQRQYSGSKKKTSTDKRRSKGSDVGILKRDFV